jgi:glutamyl-tRNA synthetase
MHLGNARTALFSFLFARAHAGRFLLRIEDTDLERSQDIHLQSLIDDLRWLGIDWDAGPDREDGHGPYRQSRRAEIYARHYRALDEQGLTYPCYCSPFELEVSRRAQLAAGRPPRYAGTCRELTVAQRAQREAEGRQAALRFRVPESRALHFDDLVRGPQRFEAGDIGDFIVRRADGTPAFFFCNAVDDAVMGVTHVLRGEDHLANTPRQLMMIEALGLAAPKYGHLPLLLGDDGAPLSKRAGSASVAQYRERGYLPGALANHLLRLGHAGAPDEYLEAGELAGHFFLDRVGKAPARFDEVQLHHWQREAVRRLDAEGAYAWMAPSLPPGLSAEEARSLATLVLSNVLFPDDAEPWAAVLYGQLPALADEDRAVVADAGASFFAAALDAYDASGGDAALLTRLLRERTGRKGAALYKPLRIALTGRHDGPEFGPMLAALSPDTVRARLAACAR